MAAARLKVRLKKRERAMLGLAGVAIAVYLVLSLAVLPAVRRYEDAGSSLEEGERVLEGYRQALGRERDLSLRLREADAATEALRPSLLTSDKPSLAAAELQNLVKEAAGTRGLQITSEKIVSPVKGEWFTVIPVEVTASGQLEHLTDFLYAVETGRPALSVPEMTIRVNKKRTFDAATKKYLDLEELQATVLVTGLMREGEEGGEP
jgi:Tfp pilus assembly protein PilO